MQGADSLYRLADRIERDARVRVHRSLLDDVADRVERLEPADDPVVAPVRVAVAELRRQLRAQNPGAAATDGEGDPVRRDPTDGPGRRR